MDHTLICPQCGEAIGHAHQEECELGPGIVLATQAADVSGQHRCFECRQRVGRDHLPGCSLGGAVIAADAVPPGEVEPELAERAAAVREDLAAEPRPNVVTVKMEDDAPTTPEAVARSVDPHLLTDAEVVIGVWNSGHVVVAKSRHGATGTAEPMRVGRERRPMSVWPRKLIWGMYSIPTSGPMGVVSHPQDIPEIARRAPEAEFEPYIPTRNILAELRSRRGAAEQRARMTLKETDGVEAATFDLAIQLIEQEVWPEIEPNPGEEPAEGQGE